MKIYFLIVYIYFCFFGYFLNAKFTDTYYLYDINFFNETQLLNEDSYLFRIKVQGKTNININFKTTKNRYEKLNVSLNYFSKYPDYNDMFPLNETILKITTLCKQSNDFYYDYFSLNSTVPNDSRYLMISIQDNQTSYFDFLSIYVSYYDKLILYYNISYKEEYELNKTDLINNIGIYIFKLKKENEENAILKLKINKEAYPDRNMVVNLLVYNEEPIYEYDYNNYITSKELLLDSKITDKKYSTYGYLFDTINNKYLVFNITIDKKMDYFSIYVYPDEESDKSDESEQSEEEEINSEEEKIPEESKNSTDTKKNNKEQLNSNTIIILIINLSIVVLLVILYCFCKKFDD